MEQRFHVPAAPLLKAAFYGAVLVVAGATAWSFRAGYLWTGICILAVAVPIGVLYWYMLILNPGRARIDVTNDGLLIHAPPFLETAIPFDQIKRSFDVQFKRGSSLGLQKKPEKGMRLGSYRSGVFRTKNGQEAIVLANQNQGLGLDIGERLVLLGPRQLDALRKAIGR